MLRLRKQLPKSRSLEYKRSANFATGRSLALAMVKRVPGVPSPFELEFELSADMHCTFTYYIMQICLRKRHSDVPYTFKVPQVGNYFLQ